MMVRLPDDTLPPSELLYRSISPKEWIDGDAVLDAAIDLPATSFNRSSYSRPEDVLIAERPDDTGIAELRVGDLPPPMMAPGGEMWEYLAADDPTDKNPAHAEVRVKTVGQPYQMKKPGSKAFKRLLREALAGRMRVIQRPT